MSISFDITSTDLRDGLYIEASAGTGKTWSIAALVAREIALRDDLVISQILVTTFTRNAAAELRDRVRRRLIDTAVALTGDPQKDDDALVASLRHDDPAETAGRIARLRRASVEFDTATISTIHSVCSRILAQAGLPGAAGEDDVEKRIVAEKVNDFVVAEAVEGRVWDSGRLEASVRTALSAPDAELWISDDLDGEARTRAEAAKKAVATLVEAVRNAMELTPTFDDLVRRAAQVVSVTDEGAVHAEARRVIGERYRLVLVDEAQDTDPSQWDVFRGIVAASGVGAMIVVGDPKQSIYRFRGADIGAYSAGRRADSLVTLGVNWRSDRDLVDALNHLLAGTTYGPSIDYQRVQARPSPAGANDTDGDDAEKNPATALVGGPVPLEIVDMPGVTNAPDMCAIAAARVVEILRTATFTDRHGNVRAPHPSEVCVLVGSNANGRMIENRLRRLKVPAVSGGTGSVIAGEVAADLRAILRACAQPSNVGRVRRASATMFLGGSLLGSDVLADEALDGASATIHALARSLRRFGVPAFAGELMRVATERGAMLASDRAERRMTDFRHLMELLDTGVGGTEPDDVLETLVGFDGVDPRAELVARRVESDSDAVVIMTIHGAKGLEFPFVVVADLWKPRSDDKRKHPIVVGRPGRKDRILDVGWAHPDGGDDPQALFADRLADEQEQARRFYVAVTRARHHLSILRPVDDKKSRFADFVTPGAIENPASTMRIVTGSRAAVAMNRIATTVSRHLATFGARVERTYRRTSFTGIVAEAGRGGRGDRGFTAPGSGLDEETGFFDLGTEGDRDERPIGADMPLALVPAGADVGTVIHSIFEDIDTSAPSLRAEIERCVDRHATGPRLRPWRDRLVDGLEKALTTGLGGFMGGVRLADIAPADRLAELSFEMGLAHLSAGVSVADVGRVLVDRLSDDDPLCDYARELVGPAFAGVPLAGLINGSIDAVLRVPVDGAPRLFITDYKSNRLGNVGDATHISAYAPSQLTQAMVEHHYPLQALIYGVALHRFLRWRAPDLDSDDVIGGVAYFFLRGMTADSAFVENGVPYGVFQWRAPRDLWAALSDAMSGRSEQ